MTNASTIIDTRVAERAMLKHPFYQAWTEGRLPLDTLRDYARQYFHHVEAFPRAVSAVHSACPDRDGRRMLAENLAEEEGIDSGKQDHASLWLMFACGLGESEQSVRAQSLNAETQGLIDTFRKLSRQSYAAGLGALYAYESQFPGVASAKIEGLVDRYGVTYPILRDRQGWTWGRYGLKGLPETWFVDTEGRLVGERFEGPVTAEELDRNIRVALGPVR